MVDELSIIIPTLNEERYLPKLLKSILAQKFLGKLQVIVVDGKSTDNTVAVANSFERKFADLKIVKTTAGIGSQRNIGAKKAKYKYILFIDADIILTKNFLRIMSRRAPQGGEFIASFFMWGSEVNIGDYLSYLIFFPLFLPLGILHKATPGGIMLTTKKIHERVGGFEEKLRLAEDLEYGNRVTASGARYRFFLIPFAFHSPRRLRKMGRLSFWMLYLKGYFHLKKNGIASLGEKIHYPYGDYDTRSN